MGDCAPALAYIVDYTRQTLARSRRSGHGWQRSGINWDNGSKESEPSLPILLARLKMAEAILSWLDIANGKCHDQWYDTQD